MRLLVVEDEPRLAKLIRKGLMEEGHAVDLVESGEEALTWINTVTYDAIILDLMLPGMDGIELCRTLRARRNKTPVLMLTARGEVDDRVTGLDAGADDYLAKPFAFAELFARLRALSRRPGDVLNPVLHVGDLTLDPASRRVWRSEHEYELTNKEFRILEILMRNADRVVTRTMIGEQIWDYDSASYTNVIDVHIRSLRKKLDDPYDFKRILTARGVGYKVVSDAD